MKSTFIVPILFLVMTNSFPVWAVEAHHPQLSGQTATEMTQDQIDYCIKTMEASRIKMANASNLKEQKALMHANMQHMKDGMKMMEIMNGKEMMSYQDDHYMEMIEMMEMVRDVMSRQKMIDGKMEIMMEMMRGLMIQQEIMMKINKLISI